MSRPPRWRRWRRLRQIVNVAAAHGFGYVVEQLGLGGLLSRWRRPGPENGERPRLARGDHLVRALEELGPTFIKLGQILSTRADLLPADIIAALRRLQDQVPPFPFEAVRGQVERELGAPLEELFAAFSPVPLAAASIGQVHEARLAGGGEVVVKVQRPELEELVETDLEILFEVARLADRHTAWGRLYDFSGMVEEFAATLREEMDYLAEARHAERFRQNLADMPGIYIPEIYWDYTTRRVLTMEKVAGVKLNDPERLGTAQVDRPALARLLTQAVLKQMFLHGFFHADLHPGNLAVLPGSVLAFMDFGMVGRLSPERRAQCLELIRGLLEHDSGRIVRAMLAMGVVPPGVDRQQLRHDVDRLRDRYYEVPFRELALNTILEDFLTLAFRHRLRLPAELTMLAKTLVTLEGVARELDPALNIAEVAAGFGRELVREQLQPEAIRRRLRRAWEEAAALAVGLPRNLHRLLDRLANESLHLELEHRGFSRALGQLDRIANRLSFAIVLLSFSIVMTGLVISSALVQEERSLFFWRLPILEIGFAAATVMVFWLIVSIFRSGRF